MHKKNPKRGSAHRGGRVSHSSRNIRKTPPSPSIRPTQPSPSPRPEFPPYENKTEYHPGSNFQPMEARMGVSKTVVPDPPYDLKRQRETGFQNQGAMGSPFPKPEFMGGSPLLTSVQNYGSTFPKPFDYHKEYDRGTDYSKQLHLNTLIPMNQQFGGYVPMQSPMVVSHPGEFAGGFGWNQYSDLHTMFRARDQVSPPMVPTQPIIYDNMAAYNKMGFSPPVPVGYPDHKLLVSPKAPVTTIKTYEMTEFKMVLDRFQKVLEKVDSMSGKIRFSVPSIFRTRVGYKLRPFELDYLLNVERMYKYLLFVYLMNGYKQQMSFSTDSSDSKSKSSKDLSGTDDDVTWDSSYKITKFANSESDIAIISNTRKNNINKLVGDGYALVKWDTEPYMTYVFNNDDTSNKSENIILVRLVNINLIINYMLSNSNNINDMYNNVDNNILKLIGYYFLVCSDEIYIVIISSIIKKFNSEHLKMLYYNLSLLLDTNRCNLKIYYLERLIERILPICLNKDIVYWKLIIKNVINIIDPIKLINSSNKKYLTCYMLLVRLLKSFSNVFVNCDYVVYKLFFMCVKYLLLLLDDTKIMVKNELTDFLIQLFLNNFSNANNNKGVSTLNKLENKNVIDKVLNYDVVKILGVLSCIQSIKLNIWSYLLLDDNNKLEDAKDDSKDGNNNESLNVDSDDSEERTLNAIYMNNINIDKYYISLMNNSECVYLFNLLNYIIGSKSNNNNEVDRENNVNVLLYWYLNYYLKINKGLVQYEKLSLIIRMAFMFYKYNIYYIYNNNKVGEDGDNNFLYLFIQDLFGDCYSTDNDKKGVDKRNKTSIYNIVEYVLCILINNINTSNYCLELANVKLSIVIDLLMFNYRFNYNLLNDKGLSSDYVMINDSKYLNLVCEGGNSRLLLDNLHDLIPSVSNGLLKSDGVSKDKKTLDYVSSLLDDGGFNCIYNYLMNKDDETSLGLENILLNVYIMVHLMNTNLDILKMVLDYLENTIYYYDVKLTGIFCLNVISSLVVTNIMLFYHFDRNSVRGKFKDLNEVNNTVMKRLYIYKLLLLFNVNTSSIDVKHTKTKDNYVMLYLEDKKNNLYDGSLIKFVSIQSYVLLLEFFYNYNNHFIKDKLETDVVTGVKDKMIVCNLGELIKNKNDNELVLYLYNYFSNFDYDVSHDNNVDNNTDVNDNEEKNRDNDLVSYVVDVLNSNTYNLPCYYLQYNNDFGDSPPIGPDSNDNNVDDSKHEDNKSFLYNINRYKFNVVYNTSNNNISYIVDMLVNILLYDKGLEKNIMEFLVAIYRNISDSESFDDDNSNMEVEDNNNCYMILYELLYYICILSLLNYKNPHQDGEYGDHGPNDVSNTMVSNKLVAVLELYDKLLDRLSSISNNSKNFVFSNFMKMLVNNYYFNGNSNTNNYGINNSMNIENVLKIIVYSRLLFKYFKDYPVLFYYIVKLLKTDSLLNYLALFENLFLTNKHYFNNRLNETDGGKAMETNNLLNILDNNKYVLYIFNRVLLKVLCGYKKDGLLVDSNEVHSVDFSNKTIVDNNNMVLNNNWFRFYFLYVQLLTRLYEIKYFYLNNNDSLKNKGKEVNTSNSVLLGRRNFYNNFKTNFVPYKQFHEFEYLTKDVVSYLLNDKKAIHDGNLVCYIGNSGQNNDYDGVENNTTNGVNSNNIDTDNVNTTSGKNNRTLFVYYMNGYNLNTTNNMNLNDNENNLYVLLYLLYKLSIVNNLRLLQVVVFSIYPILIHIIPNKLVFDYVYNTLVNIISSITDYSNNNEGNDKNKKSTAKNNKNNCLYINKYKFMMFLLLNVLLNWYHKYFFTYNFFISQYNDNNKIDKNIVDEYINRYSKNNFIEFNFNHTNVKIPIQYVYQLRLLF